MLIGISGTNGAGKGEIIRYLEERSFYPLSLSDVIRQELAERGLEEGRERMIEVGRELRRVGGPAVLAHRIVPQLAPDRNYAIDSIRHPGEVEVLRRAPAPFYLVWVDAEPEVRLERMRRRGRPGDPDSLAELERLEGMELRSDDPSGQQLEAVRALADFVVRNDHDLDALHAELRAMLGKTQFFDRPGWDEYFMNIARVVASRSNCMKRKVAAVVVKDRRIISTGYNGTPRGARNCNEGGCPRCNDYTPGGTRLDECLCSHGEENAITQAAYHGVSLQGASIYTTFSPCLNCTKMIINAGLLEVVYNAEYPLGGTALDLLRETRVEVRRFSID